MNLNNLDYVEFAGDRGHLIWAGKAYTESDSYAGPSSALANAFGYASGDNTLVTTQTYTSARTTRFSRHSVGNASAIAYSSDSESSQSVSASRYRSSSFFGNISSSSSYSSSSNS